MSVWCLLLGHRRPMLYAPLWPMYCAHQGRAWGFAPCRRCFKLSEFRLTVAEYQTLLATHT